MVWLSYVEFVKRIINLVIKLAGIFIKESNKEYLKGSFVNPIWKKSTYFQNLNAELFRQKLNAMVA